MSQDRTPAEKSPALEQTEDTANLVERVRGYIGEVRREMTQVNWPNWAQIRSTTLVVLFFTFAMTAFISVIDGIARFLYQLVAER